MPKLLFASIITSLAFSPLTTASPSPSLNTTLESFNG